MLCKHEVVGSIPSCSTMAFAMASPLPRRWLGVGGSSEPRHRPPRLPEPVRIIRNSPPGSSRPAHRSPFGLSVLFDIVKSECVRPSGLAVRHAQHAAAARTDGPIQPPLPCRRETVCARRGRVTTSLTARRLGHVWKQKVFVSPDGWDTRRCRLRRSANPRVRRTANFRIRQGWSSIMRAIKCHKGIWWMPWR